MRFAVRALCSLLLVGGLALFPAAGDLRAASATREGTTKPAAEGSLDGVGVLFKLNLLSTLATSCDTTTGALTAAFAAGGKSVLAICQATNPAATVNSLATALLAGARTTLDAEVRAGRITPAQETTLLADVQAGLPTWLTTPLGAISSQKTPRAQVNLGLDSLASSLAASCDTTAAALISAIDAGGKSVLAICQATNPAATAGGLVDVVLAALKTKLDAAVSRGIMTAADEGAMLAAVRTKLANWIVTPLPAGTGDKTT